MDRFANLILYYKGVIWGAPLLLFIIVVGIYLTFLLCGVQFRYLGYGLRLAFSPPKDKEKDVGDISRFEALMTSLAGAIGTGNIVGIAMAVTLGGVGAIFWVWVTALIGMAIKYAEGVLAVKYRIVDERGEMSGGPMYYIERGLGWKWLAVIFAMLGSLAAISTGNLVQVNSIADVLRDVWQVDPIWSGSILALLTGCVLLGGIRSIGHVAGVLVPVMALLYIAGSVVILAIHFMQIPSAVLLILTSAFTGQAAVGGFVGSTMMMAIQMGVSRGVFSSEAGLGISSIAAAAAKTDSPGRQAMISMTGTFLSTIVVCSMTGLILTVTGVFGQVNADGQLLHGAPMAVAAFESTITGGGYIATIGLVLFAYSTVIGWAYYGEKCFEYLLGEKVIWLYRILFTALVIPGAVMDLNIAWAVADVCNGLMVIPNLIALVGLSGVILTETRNFRQLVKEEKEEEWTQTQR